MEDVKSLPSHQHFDNPAAGKKHKSLTSHHLKWSFLFLISVILSLFLCLLFKTLDKREVKYSQMETNQLALEAWWTNTSCGGFTPF